MSPSSVRRLAVAFAMILLAHPARAQSTERDAILATVDRLFAAMQSRDTSAARRALATGSRVVSVRGDTARVPLVAQADTSFLRSLAAGTDRYLERIWAPEVRVRGPLATVWAPYDFHLNGVRSHCGVDAFTLVRTPSGWQVSEVIYTVERAGCADSPLGPPK
jgi:hypothetical protein